MEGRIIYTIGMIAFGIYAFRECWSKALNKWVKVSVFIIPILIAAAIYKTWAVG